MIRRLGVLVDVGVGVVFGVVLDVGVEVIDGADVANGIYVNTRMRLSAGRVGPPGRTRLQLFAYGERTVPVGRTVVH